MRKFDLSLRSSRSSYFATFRHQLTILSKTDALDEEKWLNMLGTFVKDWFRYESHFVHGRDSLEIGRAVQQECRDRKSGSAGMPRPISYAVFCLKKKKNTRESDTDYASTSSERVQRRSIQRLTDSSHPRRQRCRNYRPAKLRPPTY